MTVTQVDIDDTVLAAAMRLMGTKTKKDTVNHALREHVRRVERLHAAERLAERGARGEFDEAATAHAAARRALRRPGDGLPPGHLGVVASASHAGSGRFLERVHQRWCVPQLRTDQD